MSESSDSVEATVRAWKAKLQREHVSHAGRAGGRTTDPVTELQQIAQSLEADLADALKKFSEAAMRGADLEARAMKAIHGGNDFTARRLLLAQQECMETLAQLDADAKVVRALLIECEEVIGEIRAQPPIERRT